MAVKPIPEGSHSITPHLVVNNGAEAVTFYKNAFGAEVLGVHYTPDGKVMHAELKVGDSKFMLADEFPGMSSPSPKTLRGTCVVLNLYSANVDSLFDQGGKGRGSRDHALGKPILGRPLRPDTGPFGHVWALGQHIEDVAPDEMERRGKELFAKMSAGKS